MRHGFSIIPVSDPEPKIVATVGWMLSASHQLMKMMKTFIKVEVVDNEKRDGGGGSSVAFEIVNCSTNSIPSFEIQGVNDFIEISTEAARNSRIEDTRIGFRIISAFLNRYYLYSSSNDLGVDQEVIARFLYWLCLRAYSDFITFNIQKSLIKINPQSNQNRILYIYLIKILNLLIVSYQLSTL